MNCTPLGINHFCCIPAVASVMCDGWSRFRKWPSTARRVKSIMWTNALARIKGIPFPPCPRQDPKGLQKSYTILPIVQRWKPWKWSDYWFVEYNMEAYSRSHTNTQRHWDDNHEDTKIKYRPGDFLCKKSIRAHTLFKQWRKLLEVYLIVMQGATDLEVHIHQCQRMGRCGLPVWLKSIW